MHYYQFNIGDYAKSTLHLSLLEDLAYRRLLDRYYDTEKPLESDIDKLCRFIRMSDHKKETKQIIEEYFSLTQKGWIQKRVKKELDASSAKADAARANGKKGGRPKKTQSVNSANPDLTQKKAKQETLNKKQEPLNIYTTKHFKEALLSAGADSLYVDTWIAIRKKKRATNSEIAFNSFIKQVQISLLTINQCLEMACENSWSGFKAEWIEKTNQPKRTRGDELAEQARSIFENDSSPICKTGGLVQQSMVIEHKKS